MSNYFTMYKIVAVLAFAYHSSSILCTTKIVYTISVYYFSIMVAEKGRVTEKGHIQIFNFLAPFIYPLIVQPLAPYSSYFYDSAIHFQNTTRTIST